MHTHTRRGRAPRPRRPVARSRRRGRGVASLYYIISYYIIVEYITVCYNIVEYIILYAKYAPKGSTASHRNDKPNTAQLKR